jgi:hypothetical protein
MLRAWITAMLAGLAAGGTANAATRQVLGDGHASIVFPKPPGKMKLINETPPGSGATAMPPAGFKSAETWMARDGEAMFQAMALETPNRLPAPPVCAAGETTSRSAYALKHTCRLIQLDGVTGTETRMESREGLVRVVRMVSRPGQTYEVSYVRFPARGAVVETRPAAQVDAEGQAFLDSLHVDPWNARDYPARPWPPLPVPPVQH